MSDLVAIYYTSNRLDDVRPHFAKAVRNQLFRALDGEFPAIAVSQKPMPDFPGEVICVGDIGRSHLNIYRQLLTGAIAATPVPYIACCEDDAMMTYSHFRTHRPPPGKFAYDFNKWGINSWHVPPIFGYRARPVINHLIAPRELLIESLEERFAKFKDVPDEEVPIRWWGDLGRFEKKLGCKERKWEPFAAPEPGLVFSHEEAIGWLNQGARKGAGGARCTYLHPWGSAQAMIDLWNAKEEPCLQATGKE